MNAESQLMFFFSALGVFNGFLLSGYLLFFRKENKLPNYFLGLLILMLSVRIGKSVYMVFIDVNTIVFRQIGLSACFLIGIMLFYYTKSSLLNIKKIPAAWKFHIGILLAFIILIGVWMPYQTERDFWNRYFIKFIYLVWGCYIGLTIYTLRKVILRFFKKKTSCTVQEVWLLVVCASVLAIYLAYNIGRKKWYISGALSFSLVSYLLIFFLLFKKNQKVIFTEEAPKYAAKKITSTEATLLLSQLKEVMESKRLYADSEVKLKDLAALLKISTHKLSQLLNDNLGKSFSSYINELRVEESKRLLINNVDYTLEAIGFEAGFSSRSTFYTTFKKVTQKTPAEFKKANS